MAYPRFRQSRAHKKARRTTGNWSLNSATWANLDTGLDLSLRAQAGDEIELTINALSGAQAFDLYLDAVTVVSGAAVNSVGSAGAAGSAVPPYGVSAWYCWAGYPVPVGAPVLYTVVAGDIAAGVVTLRLRYATGGGARTLYSQVNNPFQWHVKNLGPPAS